MSIDYQAIEYFKNTSGEVNTMHTHWYFALRKRYIIGFIRYNFRHITFDVACSYNHYTKAILNKI